MLDMPIAASVGSSSCVWFSVHCHQRKEVVLRLRKQREGRLIIAIGGFTFYRQHASTRLRVGMRSQS